MKLLLSVLMCLVLVSCVFASSYTSYYIGDMNYGYGTDSYGLYNTNTYSIGNFDYYNYSDSYGNSSTATGYYVGDFYYMNY